MSISLSNKDLALLECINEISVVFGSMYHKISHGYSNKDINDSISRSYDSIDTIRKYIPYNEMLVPNIILLQMRLDFVNREINGK